MTHRNSYILECRKLAREETQGFKQDLKTFNKSQLKSHKDSQVYFYNKALQELQNNPDSKEIYLKKRISYQKLFYIVLEIHKQGGLN